MQKIKAVIFDIDGTLGNTVPLCVQAFRQALEPQLNRPMSDEEIEAAFGPDEEGTIKSFKPNDVKKATADFMRYYEELHEEMCPQPFEGIKNLLQTLQQKEVHLVIATGKGKESGHLTLQRFGIQDYFEIIQNGSPEGSRKPEAIKQILDTLKVQEDEVVYVGDSPGDVKESHEAGIAVVAAAWADTAKKEKLKEEKPDEIFDTVDLFAQWLYKKI